jgi:hypothetical protein
VERSDNGQFGGKNLQELRNISMSVSLKSHLACEFARICLLRKSPKFAAISPQAISVVVTLTIFRLFSRFVGFCVGNDSLSFLVRAVCSFARSCDYFSFWPLRKTGVLHSRRFILRLSCRKTGQSGDLKMVISLQLTQTNCYGKSKVIMTLRCTYQANDVRNTTGLPTSEKLGP